MKLVFLAAASFALLAGPVMAADPSQSNAQGAKPSTSIDAGTNSAAKNEKAQSSTGASSGSSGTSTQMPGASDSTKPDSSLSTNGNKMKQ